VPLRLLLVEDNPGDAVIFREKLGASPLAFDLVHVPRLRDGLEALEKDGPFDLLLVDLSLPDAQGIGVVRAVREAAPGLPLIVLTGLDDATVAAEAKREGATDYLVKWYMDSGSLARYIRYAVEQHRLMSTAQVTPVPSAPLEAPAAPLHLTRARAAAPPGGFDLAGALDAALAHAERAAAQAHRLATLLRAARGLRDRERDGAAPAPDHVDLAVLVRESAARVGVEPEGDETLQAVADRELLVAALDHFFDEVTGDARPRTLRVLLESEGQRAFMRCEWTVDPGRAPSGEGGDPVAALGLALCDRLVGLAGGSFRFACTRAGHCEATASLPAHAG
jgi:CheY-like chemotaxis protein